MGAAEEHPPPVRLFFALMTAEAALFDRAEAALAEAYGPIDERDETFDFDAFTDYYAAEFGTGLGKRLVSVEPLIDPVRLVDIKRETNELERGFARHASPDTADPPRRVNIDPGYVEPGKVVLASTKDHSHRIYVGRGIYEEVTLTWSRRTDGFEPMPWAYPDYRQPARLAFLARLREDCRRRRREDRSA